MIRLYQLLWVLDMEREVVSDLSVFHRIDDMQSMGSRRWALLVARLYAYTGSVQMRVKTTAREAATADTGGAGGGVGPAVPVPELPTAPPSPMVGGKKIESTQTSLQFSDIGDMFSFG